MKFEGLITVEKVILHILNSKNNKCKLSDFEISLNTQLNSKINAYIIDSSRDDAKVFSVFQECDDNVIYKSCKKIKEKPECFVDQSQKIARELYKAMKGTNAASANLLIVKYKHGEESALGIFKIELGDTLLMNEKPVKDKYKISLEAVGNAISDSRKLQKCALIYEDVFEDESNPILLLDKQDNDVSDYFMRGFLGCELLSNSKKNTKEMIKKLSECINTVYENNEKELIEKTHKLTDIFENNKEFILETAVTQIFSNDEIEKKVILEINEHKIDNTFSIDEAQVKKLVKRRTIVTSNGINLKGKASLFNPNEIDVGDPYEDGSVDITIKRVRIIKNII